MKLSGNVRFFLELQSQLKVLHWQTKSHAKHIAFGEVYDSLDDLIDKFVEIAMGIYGRFSLSEEDRTLMIQNLSDVDVLGMIKTVRGSLQEMEINPKDTDLLNIKDEMLAEINKLSYLLTLR